MLYHSVFMDWEWKLAKSEVIIAHFSWCLLYGSMNGPSVASLREALPVPWWPFFWQSCKKAMWFGLTKSQSQMPWLIWPTIASYTPMHAGPHFTAQHVTFFQGAHLQHYSVR